MIVNCIFDNTTKRGKDADREPGEGEFAVGLDTSILGWFFDKPSRYQYVDGFLGLYPTWQAEEAAAAAANAQAILDIQARIAELEAAREAEGLNNYTVAQAKAWVNGLFEAADTPAKVKQAMWDFALKLVTYSLPK